MELHEEITKVAQDLYEKSERIEGRDFDNWLEAEKIVMARYRKQEVIGAEKPTSKKRASTTKKTVAKAKKTKS
jgi:hypothetical protein